MSTFLRGATRRLKNPACSRLNERTDMRFYHYMLLRADARSECLRVCNFFIYPSHPLDSRDTIASLSVLSGSPPCRSHKAAHILRRWLNIFAFWEFSMTSSGWSLISVYYKRIRKERSKPDEQEEKKRLSTKDILGLIIEAIIAIAALISAFKS